jgi:hypothetical protein
MESAVTMRSTPGTDLDLDLDRGRVVVVNEKPQGEARVRVRFEGEIWDLTLPKPGCEAALEFRHSWPPGSSIASGIEDLTAEAHLFALHGGLQLRIRYDSYSLREAPGSAEFSWNNVGGVSRRPQELQQLPTWTNPPTFSQETQEALANFQARLAAGEPIVSLLKESLKKPDSASRIFAVYGLGAIDEMPALLDVLGNEQTFAEVRRAALEALRHWTARDIENHQKLFAALEKKYSSPTAEIVIHLLHGFSEMQLKQPAVYTSLIGYLQHPDLPVRELAFHHLLALVPAGRAIPYGPAGDPDQRRRAVEEWKKLIPEGSVPR